MGNTGAGINREADTATIHAPVCCRTSSPVQLRFHTSRPPPSFHPPLSLPPCRITGSSARYLFGDRDIGRWEIKRLNRSIVKYLNNSPLDKRSLASNAKI